MNPFMTALTVRVDKLLPELEAIYKDFHQNPELSMQEVRTARIAADYLAAQGFEVTRSVGVTGVVGLLRNGEGQMLSSYPLTENDKEATARVAQAFEAQFGERAYETRPAGASEDFSIFGRRWNVPNVFWIVGGTDPQVSRRQGRKSRLTCCPVTILQNTHRPWIRR
jgi:metal-dependent amidase/aminoacylase/carboxypeptidase family protein